MVSWVPGGQLGDSCSDLRGPESAGSQAQPQAAAAADDAAGHGENPQPRPSGFPAAAGTGQGKHLHPGQQFARQRGELAPDLVLLIAVQRQVAQAGVLRVADPVLAPGPAPVP